MDGTPLRGPGPACSHVARGADAADESYTTCAVVASTPRAKHSRNNPRLWSRYHEIDGEWVDVDASISAMGFGLRGKAVNHG